MPNEINLNEDDLNKQISDAFCQIMDGNFPGDLYRLTGIPLKRCEEIYALYLQKCKINKKKYAGKTTHANR